MRNIIRIIILLLAASVSLGNPRPCLAHPFHTTTAEMEYNAETKRFEISLKMPAADFAQMASVGAQLQSNSPKTQPGLSVLSNEHAAKIQLTKRDLEKGIACYIEKYFSVTVGGESCRFEWIGMEEEQLNIWLYFELIPTSEQLNNLQLTNKVGFDGNKWQINTVVFVSRETRLSVKTHEQQPSVKLPDIQ